MWFSLFLFAGKQKFTLSGALEVLDIKRYKTLLCCFLFQKKRKFRPLRRATEALPLDSANFLKKV